MSNLKVKHTVTKERYQIDWWDYKFSLSKVRVKT